MANACLRRMQRNRTGLECWSGLSICSTQKLVTTCTPFSNLPPPPPPRTGTHPTYVPNQSAIFISANPVLQIVSLQVPASFRQLSALVHWPRMATTVLESITEPPTEFRAFKSET